MTTRLNDALAHLENAFTRARLPSEDRGADILACAGEVVTAVRASRAAPPPDLAEVEELIDELLRLERCVTHSGRGTWQERKTARAALLSAVRRLAGAAPATPEKQPREAVYAFADALMEELGLDMKADPAVRRWLVEAWSHGNRYQRAAPATGTGDERARAIEESARAMLTKLDRLQDALDNAPSSPGQRLLPREQRESPEHKALRRALAAPSDARPGEPGDFVGADGRCCACRYEEDACADHAPSDARDHQDAPRCRCGLLAKMNPGCWCWQDGVLHTEAICTPAPAPADMVGPDTARAPTREASP